jgi:hypothetical protein
MDGIPVKALVGGLDKFITVVTFTLLRYFV